MTHDLEYYLWRWHAGGFPNNLAVIKEWDAYVKHQIKVYDNLRLWHVIPEDVLHERQSWRDGERKARFRFDREKNSWFEDGNFLAKITP